MSIGKSDQQVRLECIRLATALVTAKAVDGKQLIERAEAIYQFVTQPAAPARDA